jgi:hypothetical protein
MRTAILIVVALAFATPAHAASYERQSDALKVCFEQEDSSACMLNAGWVFCPHCPVFGTMLGGECTMHPNGRYRPACWYWHEDEQPPSMLKIMARWQVWINHRGWEKQKDAPYSPDIEDLGITPPARAATARSPDPDLKITVPCRSLSCTAWRYGKAVPDLKFDLIEMDQKITAPRNDEVFQMQCWGPTPDERVSKRIKELKAEIRRELGESK